jgi:aspartate 1-decarboxylase
MLRTFVSGKIHRLRVTALEPAYNGSCQICPELLAAAGITPFERVEIYSMTSLTRIATYAFPGAANGEFTLRGSAAQHFRIGDQVAVVTYRQEERFGGAKCVLVDPSDNSIEQILAYGYCDEPATLRRARGRT